MYCPRCMENSLAMKPSGVANLVMNHKQMDRSRFLYNQNRQSHLEIIENISQKVEEYFKWYSNFKNREPIDHVEIYSNDFYCAKGCPIGPNDRFSLIDELVTYSEIVAMIKKVAKKYEIGVELAPKKF